MRSDIPEQRETETEEGEFASSEAAEVVEDQADGAGKVPAGEEPAGTEADAGSAPSGDDELEALKDRFLRLAAEYDNFRKRTDRERLEGRDRAQAQLIEKLLEPLDDLQRVAHFSAEAPTAETLLEGIRMVERKFLRELEAAGLELLDARGQTFDPLLHDALMTTGTDEATEDDTVGEVFEPGYRFRGVLLRPARVQVRKFGG